MGVKVKKVFALVCMILFQYHPVGRGGALSAAATHSLHTVGKSLKIKEDFFILANCKTIVTLCVKNVQRKENPRYF